MATSQPERLIRIEEVKRLTGVSAATLYRKIAANKFPAPVHLGAVRTWPVSEVQDWITERIAGRALQEYRDCAARANDAEG